MKKNVPMQIINANAAGIDVGSRSHFVAIGQRKDDVREFGVYNEDLQSIAHWLLENHITTVAMESTGTYRSEERRVGKECRAEKLHMLGNTIKKLYLYFYISRCGIT